MRSHPLGREAAEIGEVIADAHHFVQMQTAFGGPRMVDWLAGRAIAADLLMTRTGHIMSATQNHVAAAVAATAERYRQDPNYILQMLREIQEACDWISPEAIDGLQQALNLPRTKIEGVAGFYSFLYTRPRGRYRVLFSDNITDRMLGNMELLQQHVRTAVDRARQDLGGRAGERGYHLLYRHVRPGAGAAGEQLRDHPA